MRLAVVLSVLWVTIFLEYHLLSSAEIVSTIGRYMVTDNYYRKSKPEFADSMYRINSAKIYTSDINSPEAAWECTRRCLETSGCTSFLLQPYARSCILSRLDRCKDPSNPLFVNFAYHYYELLPANWSIPPKTCFKDCITKSSCEDCGRANCSGTLCTDCLSYCWDSDDDPDGQFSVWLPDLTAMTSKFCDAKWERIFPPLYSSSNTPTGYSLKLRLSVTYSNGVVRESFFDSVTLNYDTLSVGNYVPETEDAGNYWGAPFQNRNKYSSNSTCQSFWYVSGMTDCEVNEANNLTFTWDNYIHKQGYYWEIGDQDLNVLKVIKMELWMTKVV